MRAEEASGHPHRLMEDRFLELVRDLKPKLEYIQLTEDSHWLCVLYGHPTAMKMNLFVAMGDEPELALGRAWLQYRVDSEDYVLPEGV